MLIKRETLDRIAAGEVDLQFRKWRKPTVRSGGSLRTSIGMLDIVSVERVPISQIRAGDASRAGYPTRTSLLDHLSTRPDGAVYRIEVRPGGADPLIALRNDSDLTSVDIEDIGSRLERLDRTSAHGPWTGTYLAAIEGGPHVRAEDLAASLGLPKHHFKAHVRKLKALGLTISHSPGYALSPRGRAYREATADSR